MLDPFRLAKRLFRAILTISGRLFVATCKAVWYGPHGRREKIGNVLDQSMRTIAGAIANIFRR